MYTQKVGGKYFADCSNTFGRYSQFSEYIREYGGKVEGHGLDLGAGPDGPNAQFFVKCSQLDGCDIEEGVANSLPTQLYSKRFIYKLGAQKLPYENNELDFVVCSCVIHHLQNQQQLKEGIREMCRVIKPGGSIFLMFKVGVNNTILKHYHCIFKEYRQVRVFGKDEVKNMLQSQKMRIDSEQILGDINWVPYVCFSANKLPAQL